MELKIIDIMENGYRLAKKDNVVYFVLPPCTYNDVIKVLDFKEYKKNIMLVTDYEIVTEDSLVRKKDLGSFFDNKKADQSIFLGAYLNKLDYDTQKSLKLENAKRVISKQLKLNKLDDDKLDPKKEKLLGVLEHAKVFGDDKIYNYRNKITLNVIQTKKDDDFKYEFAYFDSFNKKWVPIESCILTTEDLNKIVGKLKRLFNSKEVKEKYLNKIFSMDLAKKDDQKVLSFNVIKANEGIFLNVKGQDENISKDEKSKLIKELYEYIKENLKDENIVENGHMQIGDMQYLVTKNSFFQVNENNNVILYDIIKDYTKRVFEKKNVDNKEKEKDKLDILDVYCGVGSIGIYQKEYLKSLVGIEYVQNAIDCANENAKNHGIQKYEFYAIKDSDKKASKIVGGNYDLVIFDPPRAGIAKNMLDEIKSDNIIYVSCNVGTFARDVEILLEKGYMLYNLSFVDMFPNTTHVETVGLLAKVN